MILKILEKHDTVIIVGVTFIMMLIVSGLLSATWHLVEKFIGV